MVCFWGPVIPLHVWCLENEGLVHLKVIQLQRKIFRTIQLHFCVSKCEFRGVLYFSSVVELCVWRSWIQGWIEVVRTKLLGLLSVSWRALKKVCVSHISYFCLAGGFKVNTFSQRQEPFTSVKSPWLMDKPIIKRISWVKLASFCLLRCSRCLDSLCFFGAPPVIPNLSESYLKRKWNVETAEVFTHLIINWCFGAVWIVKKRRSFPLSTCHFSETLAEVLFFLRNNILDYKSYSIPIGSMYSIFTYIYSKTTQFCR